MLSLDLIKGAINPLTRQRMIWIGYSLGGAYATATLVITIYFLSLGNSQPSWGLEYLAYVFSSISIIYIMVIVKLNFSMANIQGDFSNEIFSINC